MIEFDGFQILVERSIEIGDGARTAFCKVRLMEKRSEVHEDAYDMPFQKSPVYQTALDVLRPVVNAYLVENH